MYLWVHHFKWACKDFLKCINKRKVDLFCLRCSSVRSPVRHGQIWLLIWHRSPLFMSKCFDWPGSDKRHNLLTHSLTLLVDCTLPLQHCCSKQINQRKGKKKGKMRSIHLSATFFTFCRLRNALDEAPQPGITHFSWPALRHTVDLQLRTSLQVEHSAAFPKTVGRSGH